MSVGLERHRLTVVEDSSELLALFGDALQDAGMTTTLLTSATLHDIEESAPDLLVIDLRLGPNAATGLELIRLVRSAPALRGVPIIVCSAAVDEINDHDEELRRTSALFVLTKPFSLDELESCLQEALGYEMTSEATAS